MKIASINPATGQVNKEFETFSKEELNKIVKRVHDSFLTWSGLSLSVRTECVRKLANVLKEKSEEYGKVVTNEMGKPIKQAIAEVEGCAVIADTYADNAGKWLAEEPVETESKRTFIIHQPIGIILGIMPWNHPFRQAMCFAIPAVTVGNTAILRHSNVCPVSAMAIEEAFKLAGFPENVLRTVITDHDSIKMLISSKHIAGIAFTGSIEAGRKIATYAAKNLKKSVLELGGCDPFIVLDDADLDLVCKNAIYGRLTNSGQSCTSAKRFIVVKDKADAFVSRFLELMKAQKLGDPMDTHTDVGPLANKQQLETIERQVGKLVAASAKVACGGKRVQRVGFFYEPTLLTNLKPSMVAKEEIFGPVAMVIVVKDEKEAIKVANNTGFGLGASIWTKDLGRGERVAREIESGMVYVNNTVRADARLPFGGVKKSGIGRELSRYGLLEFTNIKPIVIN